VVPFADGDGIEHRIVVQGVRLQSAEAFDEPPRRFGRFRRLQQSDARGQQRQADSSQQHGQSSGPSAGRKRRLDDPGQAQGRAHDRQSGGR
jgi:hypothetical protein